jgi:hypothetical protein
MRAFREPYARLAAGKIVQAKLFKESNRTKQSGITGPEKQRRGSGKPVETAPPPLLK